MKKEYIPQIRIVSVDHDRTMIAEQCLRHALDQHGLKKYQVRSVFCHLEAGRCGVKSGVVGLELDGRIIWMGKELTPEKAEEFCAGIENYVQQQMKELGMVYEGIQK